MADILFDDQIVLSSYSLDLLACYVTPPVRKTHIIPVPFGDGEIDAMQGRTPVYDARMLTMVFRMLAAPSDIMTHLQPILIQNSVQIVTPDNSQYFWEGRIDISGMGSDIGDLLTMTAKVSPWRTSRLPISRTFSHSNVLTVTPIINQGFKAVVPTFIIEKSTKLQNSVDFTTQVYSPGTYTLPEYVIPPEDSIQIRYTGGPFRITFLEAIL